MKDLSIVLSVSAKRTALSAVRSVLILDAGSWRQCCFSAEQKNIDNRQILYYTKHIS